MAEAADQTREVLERCRALGFALAGICQVRPSEHGAELRDWLSAGKHGSMHWLEANTEVRLDAARFLPGARSIIVVADQYAHREGPASSDSSWPRGFIARYARGDDYHDVMKNRLHMLCDALRLAYPSLEFRAFVDTAPVLEREHAARAGLGWIGKHTLLIHPRLGSWLLLGGVITTLELAPPPEQSGVPDHCGTCTRCIDACPTGAITPHTVDARRCISYLTIEHRGLIDPDLFAPIGDNLFGCDICQEVCPHNSPRPESREHAPEVHPAYTPRRSAFDLLEVLGWTEEHRRAAFARSALKRAKLDMMKRNAVIAAGNHLRGHADPRLLARLRVLVADESEPPLVRTTAAQVLSDLDGPNPIP